MAKMIFVLPDDDHAELMAFCKQQKCHAADIIRAGLYPELNRRKREIEALKSNTPVDQPRELGFWEMIGA